MENQVLVESLAFLEFEHDQLIAEYSDLNELLYGVGFPKGVQSIKEVAADMIREKDRVIEN